MGLWKSLRGAVQIEITGADIGRSLRRLNEAGITLEKITVCGNLRISACIERKDYPRLVQILTPFGDEIRATKHMGIYWKIHSLQHRPVLMAGLFLYLVFFMFLSTRVLFVTVKGNEQVPARYILEEAKGYGLSFGVSNWEVRSEKIKNGLLEKIPQLQWVGVNISGCVAEISVEEQPSQEKSSNAGYPVSHIVAKTDGVILSCTVREGNTLCTVGQAVRKGQILVSGYTDCGLTIQAGRSDGEIYGQTLQNIQALVPEKAETRVTPQKEYQVYTLIVGSRQYTWGDTQIWQSDPADSIKTVQRYQLTLPGGFALPVALEKATYTFYKTEEAVTANQWDISEYAQNYLKNQMIAGEILEIQEDFSQEGGVLILHGKYRCKEMIGLEVPADLPGQENLPQRE